MKYRYISYETALHVSQATFSLLSSKTYSPFTDLPILYLILVLTTNLSVNPQPLSHARGLRPRGHKSYCILRYSYREIELARERCSRHSIAFTPLSNFCIQSFVYKHTMYVATRYTFASAKSWGSEFRQLSQHIVDANFCLGQCAFDCFRAA